MKNRSYIYQIKLNRKQTNDVRIIASNFIPNGAKVLDVGCACGDFGVFLSIEKKCQITGMEYDKNSIFEAEKTEVYQRIHQVDLNTLQSSQYAEYEESFECITLLDVLEHTISPESSFSKLKYYLKKDGFFIVSLPNISFGDIKINLLNNDFTYMDTGIMDKTHLRFFTYKTIADFFTSAGVEVVNCEAKVFDITSSKKGLSFGVKKNIESDPHSYIYQYVVMTKFSSLKKDVLADRNLQMMDLKWKDLKQELSKIKKQKWMSMICPVNSRRRDVAKKFLRNKGE